LREGPLGTGTNGKRGNRRVRPRNRRQPGRPRLRVPPPEQQTVKAVSVEHCAATTALRNFCCPNFYAEQSHKDNVRSSAVGKQLKRKKSNSLSLSLAQHHLPALDLFWATFFVRVQLTSFLLISPGLLQESRPLLVCRIKQCVNVPHVNRKNPCAERTK